MELHEASPRYAVLQENNRLIGFQNMELLSHQTVQYGCDGIKFLKQKYPSKVLIANVMAPEHQALALTNGKIQVDKTRCVGCGLCRFVCPSGAITNASTNAITNAVSNE